MIQAVTFVIPDRWRSPTSLWKDHLTHHPNKGRKELPGSYFSLILVIPPNPPKKVQVDPNGFLAQKGKITKSSNKLTVHNFWRLYLYSHKKNNSKFAPWKEAKPGPQKKTLVYIPIIDLGPVRTSNQIADGLLGTWMNLSPRKPPRARKQGKDEWIFGCIYRPSACPPT